jgi:hypothetical protein
MMTFEQFQATRAKCDDLSKAIDDGMWDDCPIPATGFVYHDSTLFIEDVQDWWPQETKARGRYDLTLYNRQETSDDLAALERLLYDFAADEGYLDAEDAGR